MKKLSAGVILTDGRKLLVCHVTGRDFYDIPKGLVAPGEEPVQACVRETEEETGLRLNPARLLDLGNFTYTREKDLHLFLLQQRELPATANMKCTSYFLDKWGRSIPEVDGYRYITYRQKHLYLLPNLARVVEEARLKADKLTGNRF